MNSHSSHVTVFIRTVPRNSIEFHAVIYCGVSPPAGMKHYRRREFNSISDAAQYVDAQLHTGMNIRTHVSERMRSVFDSIMSKSVSWW